MHLVKQRSTLRSSGSCVCLMVGESHPGPQAPGCAPDGGEAPRCSSTLVSRLKLALWVYHGAAIFRGHTGFPSNSVFMERASLHSGQKPCGHYSMCPFVHHCLACPSPPSSHTAAGGRGALKLLLLSPSLLYVKVTHVIM